MSEAARALSEGELGLGPEDLRQLYRLMLLTRLLDREAVALQRQGEIAAFPPLAGQEAAQVGSAFAIRDGDFAFPSYRELGAAVARGVDLVAYLRAYRGDWNGGLYDLRERGFAPIASAVGSHVLHAVGWAMGARLDRRRACAICYFGEGATSEGDVHEAMNFAGVFRAPVVFFCQNNQWAISVPVERQVAGAVHRRAEGYGFPGVQVDGNDVLAVYAATREAAERARAGGGPTLIEALTYRLGPHSTADDPGRYRLAEHAEPWRRRDPIERYRARLAEAGLADEGFFEEAEREARRRVAEVREALLASQPESAETMFDFVFGRPPAHVEAQRAEWREAHGDA